MFHRESDASKVALADLVSRLVEAGAGLLEVQHQTPHLQSLGAIEIERALYLGLLAELRDDDVRLLRDRLPASRLQAPAPGI
jgi:leucyl/phenylalanyl-tRNA--protein transferase